ncbi:hypothetical protein O181_057932 [Austropuccinia psidii MF-1]|uniref:Dol-P-Man:Man(5)GlcNAc(2)-PP-Dol alpha-1,3-mannosyltransferase n=1 Tax=Austropuccinia psidii MF-1 TaxID=1389203 RepID=A0A9Q3HVX8_9BASI|nr:hypothetical protein [Austropuccinia psidii MF-1]
MSSFKLSNSLKQLLAINSHPPNLHQSKTFIPKLNQLISDFHQKATSQKLTSDTWIIFSTAAFVSLNRPSALEPFWSCLKSNVHNQQDLIHSADVIRETGLKSISFIGIAKSINALNTFRTVVENEPNITSNLRLEPRRLPFSTDNSAQLISQRALQTWKSIYRPLDERLISKLSASHPDLPVHILHSHYGPLLSDPPSSPSPIGRIGTSLIAIGTLRASGELGPQLLSHVYGLRKAGEELAQVGEPSLGKGIEWLTSNEGTEWVIDSVDRLVSLTSYPDSGNQILNSKL